MGSEGPILLHFICQGNRSFENKNTSSAYCLSPLSKYMISTPMLSGLMPCLFWWVCGSRSLRLDRSGVQELQRIPWWLRSLGKFEHQNYEHCHRSTSRRCHTENSMKSEGPILSHFLLLPPRRQISQQHEFLHSILLYCLHDRYFPPSHLVQWEHDDLSFCFWPYENTGTLTRSFSLARCAGQTDRMRKSEINTGRCERRPYHRWITAKECAETKLGLKFCPIFSCRIDGYETLTFMKYDTGAI